MSRTSCALFAVALWSTVSAALGVGPPPIGGEFQVNTYTTSYQWFPSIGVAADDSFVVVWHSDGSDDDGSLRSIQARRFTANGTPISNESLVNSTTTGDQTRPAVAVDPDGAFVVAWESGIDPAAPTSIRGQRFDGSAGTALVRAVPTPTQAASSCSVSPTRSALRRRLRERRRLPLVADDALTQLRLPGPESGRRGPRLRDDRSRNETFSLPSRPRRR